MCQVTRVGRGSMPCQSPAWWYSRERTVDRGDHYLTLVEAPSLGRLGACFCSSVEGPRLGTINLAIEGAHPEAGLSIRRKPANKHSGRSKPSGGSFAPFALFDPGTARLMCRRDDPVQAIFERKNEPAQQPQRPDRRRLKDPDRVESDAAEGRIVRSARPSDMRRVSTHAPMEDAAWIKRGDGVRRGDPLARTRSFDGKDHEANASATLDGLAGRTCKGQAVFASAPGERACRVQQHFWSSGGDAIREARDGASSPQRLDDEVALVPSGDPERDSEQRSPASSGAREELPAWMVTTAATVDSSKLEGENLPRPAGADGEGSESSSEAVARAYPEEGLLRASGLVSTLSRDRKLEARKQESENRAGSPARAGGGESRTPRKAGMADARPLLLHEEASLVQGTLESPILGTGGEVAPSPRPEGKGAAPAQSEGGGSGASKHAVEAADAGTGSEESTRRSRNEPRPPVKGPISTGSMGDAAQESAGDELEIEKAMSPAGCRDEQPVAQPGSRGEGVRTVPEASQGGEGQSSVREPLSTERRASRSSSGGASILTGESRAASKDSLDDLVPSEVQQISAGDRDAVAERVAPWTEANGPVGALVGNGGLVIDAAGPGQAAGSLPAVVDKGDGAVGAIGTVADDGDGDSERRRQASPLRPPHDGAPESCDGNLSISGGLAVGEGLGGSPSEDAAAAGLGDETTTARGPGGRTGPMGVAAAAAAAAAPSLTEGAPKGSPTGSVRLSMPGSATRSSGRKEAPLYPQARASVGSHRMSAGSPLAVSSGSPASTLSSASPAGIEKLGGSNGSEAGDTATRLLGSSRMSSEETPSKVSARSQATTKKTPDRGAQGSPGSDLSPCPSLPAKATGVRSSLLRSFVRPVVMRVRLGDRGGAAKKEAHGDSRLVGSGLRPRKSKEDSAEHSSRVSPAAAGAENGGRPVAGTASNLARGAKKPPPMIDTRTEIVNPDALSAAEICISPMEAQAFESTAWKEQRGDGADPRPGCREIELAKRRETQGSDGPAGNSETSDAESLPPIVKRAEERTAREGWGVMPAISSASPRSTFSPPFTPVSARRPGGASPGARRVTSPKRRASVSPGPRPASSSMSSTGKTLSPSSPVTGTPLGWRREPMRLESGALDRFRALATPLSMYDSPAKTIPWLSAAASTPEAPVRDGDVAYGDSLSPLTDDEDVGQHRGGPVGGRGAAPERDAEGGRRGREGGGAGPLAPLASELPGLVVAAVRLVGALETLAASQLVSRAWHQAFEGGQGESLFREMVRVSGVPDRLRPATWEDLVRRAVAESRRMGLSGRFRGSE